MTKLPWMSSAICEAIVLEIFAAGRSCCNEAASAFATGEVGVAVGEGVGVATGFTALVAFAADALPDASAFVPAVAADKAAAVSAAVCKKRRRLDILRPPHFKDDAGDAD